MSNGLTLELKLLDTLKRFRERVLEERSGRLKMSQACLPFGVSFLDEALGGIYSNDLVLYGAKTGIGKTQLAVVTATAAASLGKRVHFFALEAEPNEIERRIKYRILADNFFKVLKKDYPNVRISYMDWYYGRLETSLGKVEDEIEEMMSALYPNLWTIYREGNFAIQDFERQFMGIKDQTDLVIVDHLHYFDIDDENENRAMKGIVKRIRDLAVLSGKPVILIAHLRKSDRKSKQLVPGVDEFHGSSDITKIATKVVTLAPCESSQSHGNLWPTYMRVAKCRIDGSRTKYTGLLGFNADSNQYERNYYLGRLNPAEDEFKGIQSFNDLPYWAKNAGVLSRE